MGHPSMAASIWCGGGLKSRFLATLRNETRKNRSRADAWVADVSGAGRFALSWASRCPPAVGAELVCDQREQRREARDGTKSLEAGFVFEAVGVLERDHPAGVLGWESADLVELLKFVRGELEVDGGEVVVKLVHALGAEDDGLVTAGRVRSQARAMRAGVQPCEPRRWDFMTSRMLQVRSLSTKGEVEVGAAGAFGLLVLAGELAGEKTAGKGAPDEQAGLFRLGEVGDDLALEVAAGDGVVGLDGGHAGEVEAVGDAV